MSTLGIINSDPEITQSIELAFQQVSDHNKTLLFLVEEEEISEYLNYALPELVVINFSDPAINTEKIINQIKSDKWILNFGIIGIFNSDVDVEEELLKKHNAINLLTLLDKTRIVSHLAKNIEIIEQNYQIIFQRELSKSFLEGASGSFTIENDLLAVPLYACIGATILSQRSLINPDGKMHLQLALTELIVNAIEHGNCGITYEEKAKTLESGLTSIDLIYQKCTDPLVQAKKVCFNWEIQSDKSVFTIQDEGKGFDVKAHMEKVKRQSNYSLHGRGIKMAAAFSSKLKYNAKGNIVELHIDHDKSVITEIPAGFSREQIIMVQAGEVVLHEGESSNYLYYIASGTYEVLHKGKVVGSLSDQDIFMGEMSFILNQRRSATIKAKTAGKLVLLTQKTFVNTMRENPHYGVFLLKLLAKRLVRSNIQAAARE